MNFCSLKSWLPSIYIPCMQFLSNPVIYNFMIKKWYGKYFELAHTKHGFLDYCWWIWLHLWSIVDVVLFPLVLLLLYTVQACKRPRPRRSHSKYIRGGGNGAKLYLRGKISGFGAAYCVQNKTRTFAYDQLNGTTHKLQF